MESTELNETETQQQNMEVYTHTPSMTGYHEGVGATLGADDWNELKQLGIRSNITFRRLKLDISDILTNTFKKKSRKQTVIGLTGVIGEWGVVTPIHVLALEDEGSYMLLDGLRRIFGKIRNGEKEIEAIIWDFEDKDEGKEVANVLSLMINRSQRYSPQEIWDQIRDLETKNDLTPGVIEYLLQLDSGDSMKYKDVMLADAEYEDIKEELMENRSSIEAAYKKLTSRRKKENKLAKEDSMVLEGGGGESSDDMPLQRLSVEDVRELLELTDNELSEGETLEDMDRTAEVRGDVVQDVNDRKPIDPMIKQTTFIRDGFKCRCCGKGGAHWLGILVYHHVIPVFLHGEDSVDNGLTICSDCHITLHLYSFGKVSVDFESLDDAEKKTFRNIFKFGNIIIEGMKRVGMTKDVGYKADSGSRRHLYPGEGLKDNKEAFEVYKKTVDTKVEPTAVAE